jgi:hypothetical protein
MSNIDPAPPNLNTPWLEVDPNDPKGPKNPINRNWWRWLVDVLETLSASIAAGVTSVFGRTGAVVAVLGDYTSSLITNASGVAGATVTAALDALAALIAAIPTISAGTYTPTLTLVTNLDSTAAFSTYYIRVGASGVVFGQFTANATAAAGTATEMGMSPPVASNFAATNEAGGVAFSLSLGQIAAINADAANDRLSVQWQSLGTANNTWMFIAGFGII